jgi:hypothetical protein
VLQGEKVVLPKSMPIERISIAMILLFRPASTMYPLPLTHQTADHLINRLLGKVKTELLQSRLLSKLAARGMTLPESLFLGNN